MGENSYIMAALEEKPNEFRHRLKDPKLFKSFTVKQLKNGIYLVGGRLKKPPKGQEGSWVAQTIRFKKLNWTKKSAQEWIKKHPNMTKAFERKLNIIALAAYRRIWGDDGDDGGGIQDQAINPFEGPPHRPTSPKKVKKKKHASY